MTCSPHLCACLPTGMRVETDDGFDVGLLAAPTVVESRLLHQARVTTRAPPTFWLVRALIFLFLLHLIRVPLLDTMEMRNGPAYRTRPNPRRPNHLTSADYTFVLSAVDVLVDPCGKIGCCGLFRDPGDKFGRPRLGGLRLSFSVRGRGHYQLPWNKVRSSGTQASPASSASPMRSDD